jgi:hypothetical protein
VVAAVKDFQKTHNTEDYVALNQAIVRAGG